MPSPGVTVKRIVAPSPSSTVTSGVSFAAPFQSPKSPVASNMALTFSSAHFTASSPSLTATVTVIVTRFSVPDAPLAPDVPFPSNTSPISTVGAFANSRSAPSK